MPQRTSSLNLLTLLALSLLPGLLALLFTANRAYEHQHAVAERSLLSRVRATSQLIDQKLLFVQSGLELIATTSTELDDKDWPGLYRKFENIKSHLPLADSLVLYDPSGQIILNSNKPLGTVFPVTRSAQRIQAVAREGRARIGDVIQGTVSGRTLIPVDVPVVRNGKTIYVVTAGVYSDHMGQILTDQDFQPGWIAVIYDRTGTIIGRSLNPDAFIGKKVAETVLQWLQGPGEVLGTGKTLEGRMSVAAMHRSNLTGYSVTASVPEDVLLAPLRHDLIVNGLVVIGSLLVGLLLAWHFATNLGSAISQLEQATRRVAQGDESVQLPKGGPSEIRSLTHHFGQMVQHLQESRTERDRYQRELEMAATHDPLTGLANRALINERLEHALAVCRRQNKLAAVMLLDLDRFKLINDALTHGVGDALLIEVARRLQAQVREGDLVGRLGGDEFIVLLDSLATLADAGLVAEKLMTALQVPVQAMGHSLSITASLGIAVIPEDGITAAELLMHADLAMYRAKDSGRGRFQLFDAKMDLRLSERLALEHELRQAIEGKEFELYYQPRCEIASGKVVGAEALIRWRHPKKGMVAPGAFIPAAEESGLVVPMGAWVLQTACVAGQRWRDLGLGDLVVGVNVSARQFQSSDLAQMVKQALEQSRLPSNLLELELTESAVMANPEKTLQILNQIQTLGVRVALDDFGTGYSSLGYLKRFPVQCLKIDQSFIRDMTVDSNDAAITAMVIALGHSLHQEVVAEGVETQSQLDFLHQQGCDLMQGYYFSPPLPEVDFIALVRSGRRLTMLNSQPL